MDRKKWNYKSAKRPKQYFDLLQKYDLKRDLGIDGSVPADSEIYRKIENKYNVSINVYIFQGKNIYPIHITKELKEKHHNLLLS